MHTWIIRAIRDYLSTGDVGDVEPELLAEKIAEELPLGLIASAIASSCASVLVERRVSEDVTNERGSLSREVGNNAAQRVYQELAGFAATAECVETGTAWADAMRALERVGVPAVDAADKPMTLAERILWLGRQRPAIAPHSIMLTDREYEERTRRECERRESNELQRDSRPGSYEHPQYDNLDEKAGDK